MMHSFVQFVILDLHCLMQAVIEKRCHVKFRLPSKFVVEDNDHTEDHRRYHVDLRPSPVSNSALMPVHRDLPAYRDLRIQPISHILFSGWATTQRFAFRRRMPLSPSDGTRTSRPGKECRSPTA